MSQKYKVFFNRNLIQISDKACDKIENTPFTKIKNIRKLMLEFTDSKKARSINIVHKKPKKVIKAMKNAFTMVKAAGGLVYNSKGELLFIYRLGKWDLPKGKLEKNEKAKVGAVREVEEECGISNVKITKKLPSTFHTYYRNKQWILKETKWYKMFYDGNEKLVPQTEEDITKAEWISKEKINRVLAESYNSINELFNNITE